jgi:hypothetical protein
MTPRLAAGVALVLLVGVFVWWVGGDAPTERVARGDEAAASAREGGGSAALAPTEVLAAAERQVEARTSLDDRRAWSATLAFAPDMAWLAPQLVWRVRAAGGDGDDVVEPLAPLPPDVDGDGAIELALRAPPERAGERVVVDLHLCDGSEFCVATFDVPEDGAVVEVDWSRAPLVAAGTVLPIDATAYATLAVARGRHEPKERGVDAAYTALPDDPSVRGFVREVRGPRGEFALLGSFVLGPGGGRDGEWSIGLVEERDALCDPVTVRTGATDVVLVIERNRVRIELALDPAVLYPGLMLRVDDRAGRIALRQNLDSLKQRAVDGRCVVEVPTAAGSGAFAVVEETRVSVPLFETGFTVVPFQTAVDGSASFPSDGPYDCTRDLRIATLVVPAGAPQWFAANWLVGEGLARQSVLAPREAHRAQQPSEVARTYVFAVPAEAQRLVVEARGWKTRELGVWSAGARELVMEPQAPARMRLAWSGQELPASRGWIALMLVSQHERERDSSTGLLTDFSVHESQWLHFWRGATAWQECVPAGDGHCAVSAVWYPPQVVVVDDQVQRDGLTPLGRARIVDITCDGVSCVEFGDVDADTSDETRHVRFEPGRDYVVHLGEVIEAPSER